MDVTSIVPQLERLDGNIDKLEEALQPLLGSLSEVASKLPLLDKAKLYVLVTYSIESMLFSVLRLNEQDAKNHPVFKELTRVRQYFEKISTIENPPPKPEQNLNKEAAIRFIRADLADDKNINTKLTEMIAKERTLAAAKAAQARGSKRTAGQPSAETGPPAPAGGVEHTAEIETPPKKKSKKDKKGKRSVK